MIAIIDWKGFYDTLIKVTGYGTPVALPISSQLDAFEHSAGFMLPKSYRAFILVFGPGELSVSLRISAPGYLHAIDTSYDLALANIQYRLTESDIRRFPESMHTMLRGLYYFGYIDGRDWLAWDIGDVRSLGDHEYAIYRVSLGEAKIIATSFKELIETVCDRLFAPNPNWDEGEMGPLRSFRPATYDPTEG